MQELPAGLAEPLHLINPHPYRTALFWLGFFLVLMALWFLWRRWRRRRPRPQVRPRPATGPASAPAKGGMEEAINGIRERYIHTDIREGCHELSETLRSYFGRTLGRELSTLTVREIAIILSQASIVTVFELLAELQFRRRRPTPEEFQEICEMAITETAK